MLDTEKDSPAELIYPRLGYVKVCSASYCFGGRSLMDAQVGEIPGLMISPLDGSLKGGVLFYKDLR